VGFFFRFPFETAAYIYINLHIFMYAHVYMYIYTNICTYTQRKKHEPSKTKFSIKNISRIKPFYATDIHIHILVMGDLPFFLAVLS
jgi:hypothetical protein